MQRMRRAGLIFALAVLAAMPVGAGATGHASLAMLAFAALFLLGNAVMRPGAVRLDRGGDLALQIVTASAFAALLVGLGQSARALAGIATETDLFGWVFAGAWALLLARLVWPPKLTDRLAGAAESGLRRLDEAGAKSGRTSRAPERRGEPRPDLRPDPRPESRPDPRPDVRPVARKGPRRGAGPPRRASPAPRGTAAESPPGPRERAAQPATADPTDAARKERERPMTDPDPAPEAAPLAPLPTPEPGIAAALAPLDLLPPDATGDATLEPVLADIAADPVLAADPAALAPALAHRAQTRATERDRSAFVVLATDPEAAALRLGQGDVARAFELVVAAADAASLARFSTRARGLIDALPEAAGDQPSVPRLIEIADQIEDTLESEAESLVDLASALEDLRLATEAEAEAEAETDAAGDSARHRTADTATDEVDA